MKPLFRHLNFQKVVRAWCVLYILTWKCASRHNGVHFFDILTSKSGPSMVCFAHFHLEVCFAPHIATSTRGPTMVRFVYFDFEMCFAPQQRALFRHLNFQTCPRMMCFVHFDLEMCFAPQRRALFRHLNFQKWSEHGVLCTFSLGNVLRATTACTFFDISTSKSGPTMVCFVHFHLEMCFAPQRRALFRHLNFQKWSEHGVLRTFSLGNVLRATTACTFSTSQLPKVVRAWCVFVHFDLEMCFAPQRHLNFQKWSEHGVFCTF